MPGSVDYCRTTPSLCTNEDFDPLQSHPYSPISPSCWWHRVYMCILIHGGKFHLSPLSAVSIASMDFTRFQIVSWNPSMKLEINCASISSSLNCISNTDMFQNKFPVTILMLFKGWEFLTRSCNAQCLFYPAFLLLASPPPCVESLFISWLSCCFSG